jgi:uncharacterized protein
MTVLTARAAVLTRSPERYAKQLLSHLGRRTSWTTDGDTSTAEIAGGTGRVVVGQGVLTLIAEALDTETLGRVQFVLGSHLERFGQRNELTVTWVSDADPRGAPIPSAPSDHQRPGESASGASASPSGGLRPGVAQGGQLLEELLLGQLLAHVGLDEDLLGVARRAAPARGGSGSAAARCQAAGR